MSNPPAVSGEKQKQTKQTFSKVAVGIIFFFFLSFSCTSPVLLYFSCTPVLPVLHVLLFFSCTPCTSCTPVLPVLPGNTVVLLYFCIPLPSLFIFAFPYFIPFLLEERLAILGKQESEQEQEQEEQEDLCVCVCVRVRGGL